MTTESRRCGICGYTGSVVTSEETYLHGHRYSYGSDVCYDCGYVNQCSHWLTSRSEWPSDCEFTAVSATHHTATGTFETVVHCSLCDTYLEMTEVYASKTLEHKAYEDGICIDCGYEGVEPNLNSCEHANSVPGGKVVLPEIIFEDQTCDATHTYGGHEYTTLICQDCGEVIHDTQSTYMLKETAPHEYSDGCCAVCGHTCGHSETEVIPGKAADCTESGLTEGVKCSVCGTVIAAQEIIPAYAHRNTTVQETDSVLGYVQLDDLQHNALCKRETITTCGDCGAVISCEEEEYGLAEAHVFGSSSDDAENVCTLCGYVRIPAEDPVCLHENVRLDGPHFSGEGYEFIEITDYNHVKIGNMVMYRYCDDCDVWLDDLVVEENVIRREIHAWAALDHDYLECEICHYALPCKHDGDEYYRYYQIEDSGYTYSNITAETHDVTGVLNKEIFCSICDTPIGSETITGTGTAVHSYDENNMCRSCGYLRTCTHANMVPVECVDDTAWWGYGNYTDITETTHTCTHVIVIVEDCPDCDYYMKELKEPRTEASEVQEHTFVGNTCRFCSYVKTDVMPDENVMTLPSALKVIAEEAFMNVDAQCIVIPDGAVSIEGRAFADCLNLSDIFIPMSVENIAEDAFDGCDCLTIHCIEGSAAQEYAESHEIAYMLR